MPTLTRKQILSLGSTAKSAPQGVPYDSGVAGYPKPTVQASNDQILGLGSQAGSTDPPWLVKTPQDPLGWASIAAHLAANPQQAPAVTSSPDLSWLQGTPWADPQYWQQIAQNTRTSADTDLGLITNRDQALSGLGYNFTFDPNDPFKPTGSVPVVDPNNPFSQAQMLRTHYEAAKRGDTNNLAARGQLYSGALGNQLGLDQSSFNQSDDALVKAATRAVEDAIRNHQTNITTLGQANLDAQGAAIGRYKPGPPVPGGTATGGPPQTTATGAPPGTTIDANGVVYTSPQGGSTSPFTPIPNFPRPDRAPNLSAFPKPGTALPTGGVVPKPLVGKKIGAGYSVPKKFGK